MTKAPFTFSRKSVLWYEMFTSGNTGRFSSATKYIVLFLSSFFSFVHFRTWIKLNLAFAAIWPKIIRHALLSQRCLYFPDELDFIMHDTLLYPTKTMTDNHIMVIYILTFSPLNVNWTFRSDFPLHLKFCYLKSHYIPERIVTCTYVKMSTVWTQFTAFKTWSKLHTSNYAFSYLFSWKIWITAFSCRCFSFATTLCYIQSSKLESLVYGRHLLKSASICFCPKMPRNYVHCLPPSPPCLPLNVQLTLSGRKVNISKVPNYMQLETCTSQKAFEAWYGNRVNYRKYTILRCFA